MAGLKTRKQQRLIVVSVSLLALFGAVFLVFSALNEGSLNLFYQPTAVVEKQVPPGRTFKLGGLVEVGSFTKDNDGLTYRFVITDCETDQPVVFRGLLPDLFREGQGVVTEGALDETGVFQATNVLAKHDENYVPRGTMPTSPDQCTHPDGGYTQAESSR